MGTPGPKLGKARAWALAALALIAVVVVVITLRPPEGFGDTADRDAVVPDDAAVVEAVQKSNAESRRLDAGEPDGDAPVADSTGRTLRVSARTRDGFGPLASWMDTQELTFVVERVEASKSKSTKRPQRAVWGLTGRFEHDFVVSQQGSYRVRAVWRPSWDSAQRVTVLERSVVVNRPRTRVDFLVGRENMVGVMAGVAVREHAGFPPGKSVYVRFEFGDEQTLRMPIDMFLFKLTTRIKVACFVRNGRPPRATLVFGAVEGTSASPSPGSWVDLDLDLRTALHVRPLDPQGRDFYVGSWLAGLSGPRPLTSEFSASYRRGELLCLGVRRVLQDTKLYLLNDDGLHVGVLRPGASGVVDLKFRRVPCGSVVVKKSKTKIPALVGLERIDGTAKFWSSLPLVTDRLELKYIPAGRYRYRIETSIDNELVRGEIQVRAVPAPAVIQL